MTIKLQYLIQELFVNFWIIFRMFLRKNLAGETFWENGKILDLGVVEN